MGLISKKEPLYVQHTFFGHFFAVVLHGLIQRETSRGNVVRVLVHFFFTGAQFLLTLVCLWYGRTVGRTVTWLPNFLGWVDFLTHGAPKLSPRDSSAKQQELPKKWYIGQQGYLPLGVSMDVFKWKYQNRFVAYKTLNCKTVRVFAYSSTCE